MSKKSWLLPEFGLVTHVHNTTMKKMKAKTVPISNAKSLQTTTDYQSALQKGYEEGKAKALIEINAIVHQLNQLLDSLKTKQHEDRLKMATQYQTLIKACCESILAREIEQQPEMIFNLINVAMDQIDKSQNIKLFCSPKLASLLNYQSEFSDTSHLAVEIDNTLTEFNFKIESETQHLALSFSDMINEYLRANL